MAHLLPDTYKFATFPRGITSLCLEGTYLHEFKRLHSSCVYLSPSSPQSCKGQQKFIVEEGCSDSFKTSALWGQLGFYWCIRPPVATLVQLWLAYKAFDDWGRKRLQSSNICRTVGLLNLKANIGRIPPMHSRSVSAELRSRLRRRSCCLICQS
jgi:hypothetical protein